MTSGFNFTVGGGLGAAAKALNAGRVSSDEDGEFEYGPVEPGEYTLRAQAADGRAGTASALVGEAGAEEVVITLEQRGRVSGVVSDALGQPVSDALVSVKPAGPAGVSATAGPRRRK